MATTKTDCGKNARFTCRINRNDGSAQVFINFDDGRVANIVLSKSERKELATTLICPEKFPGAEFGIVSTGDRQ